jgi:hypothetical protein
MASEENGTRGMTQRELLLENREMLYHVTEQMGVIQRDLAVHLALPIHPGADQRLKNVEIEQASQRAYLNKVLGVVGVAVFLTPIAVVLFGK